MAQLPMDDVDPAADGEAAACQIQSLANSGFALAMQILCNRDDAADVVQDSFHAMVRKRRLFDPSRGALRPWFLKIVRNRCLDLIRQRGRRKTEALETANVAVAGEQRPDVAAERRELLAMVKEQLMAMPQDQREIILLRDYHDLSYADIAKVLSIPPGTVMSRLHRARVELKRRMSLMG
jgi:RNA polymerase sigma-70 factor (ECF subfamily)